MSPEETKALAIVTVTIASFAGALLYPIAKAYARRLEGRLASLVSKGMAAGEFRAVDPALIALTIMSNDEGVQNWFRLGTPRTPREIGEALASVVVGGLLAAGRSVDDVVHEVSTLY